ncbi:MAG: CsgG/HfaB family protein [Holophagaceae bacterium]|nr:CsgG/HfaB family protein [Holophagaceae bacterium]
MNLNLRHLLSLKLAVLSLAVFGFSPSAVAQERPKERIGVVAFENNSQVSDSAFSRGLVDILSYELLKSKKYELVEQAQMNKVIEQVAQGMAGITDDVAAEMGKIAGVDYVVMGKVLEVSEEARETSTSLLSNALSKNSSRNTASSLTRKTSVLINIKMLDVKNGKIAFIEQAEGVESSTVSSWDPVRDRYVNTALYSKLTREAIARVVRKMGIGTEATVVQVKDNMAMIDMGSNDGVIKGQRYMVIREDDPIVHPITGETVAVEETVIAYIVIETVAASTSTGKIANVQKEKVVNDRGKKKNERLEIVPGMSVRQIDETEGRSMWEKMTKK